MHPIMLMPLLEILMDFLDGKPPLLFFSVLLGYCNISLYCLPVVSCVVHYSYDLGCRLLAKYVENLCFDTVIGC